MVIYSTSREAVVPPPRSLNLDEALATNPIVLDSWFEGPAGVKDIMSMIKIDIFRHLRLEDCGLTDKHIQALVDDGRKHEKSNAVPRINLEFLDNSEHCFTPNAIAKLLE